MIYKLIPTKLLALALAALLAGAVVFGAGIASGETSIISEQTIEVDDDVDDVYLEIDFSDEAVDTDDVSVTIREDGTTVLEDTIEATEEGEHTVRETYDPDEDLDGTGTYEFTVEGDSDLVDDTTLDFVGVIAEAEFDVAYDDEIVVDATFDFDDSLDVEFEDNESIVLHSDTITGDADQSVSTTYDAEDDLGIVEDDGTMTVNVTVVGDNAHTVSLDGPSSGALGMLGLSDGSSALILLLIVVAGYFWLRADSNGNGAGRNGNGNGFDARHNQEILEEMQSGLSYEQARRNVKRRKR